MEKRITRKQIRLKNYDYSLDGHYYITLCSRNRQNIFGEFVVGADGCRPGIVLNMLGLIVDQELKNTEIIRNRIRLDQYVIMPNHLHAIIIIQHKVTGGQPAAPTNNYCKPILSSFVAGFKSVVTKRINTLRSTPYKPVWQRSFYDHIIRNERSLDAIREYIAGNPINWEQDLVNLS